MPYKYMPKFYRLSTFNLVHPFHIQILMDHINMGFKYAILQIFAIDTANYMINDQLLLILSISYDLFCVFGFRCI